MVLQSLSNDQEKIAYKNRTVYIFTTFMKSVLLVLLFFFSAAKSFGITWGTPEDLSTNNSSSSRIAADGTGKGFALWQHFDGTNEIIQATVYDGSWSGVANLSSSGFNATLANISASNGRAAAIWQLFDGANFVIQASIYSNGTWSTPEDISTPGANSFNGSISINGNGDVLAVWTEAMFPFDQIKVALYSGGTWGTPQVLSNPIIQSDYADVAFSDSGRAIAAWGSSANGDYNIQGASFTLGAWSPAVILSTPGGECTNSRVVINATGIGFAIWEKSNDSLNFDRINVSRFNGQTWSIPVTISNTTFNASNPDISLSATGNVVATWQNSSVGTVSLGANYFSGGIWRGPYVLANETPRSPVKVIIDTANRVTAVWSQVIGPDTFVRTSQFSGTSWSTPETISMTSLEALRPRMAIDSLGDVFVIWNAFDGIEYLIQAVVGVP